MASINKSEFDDCRSSSDEQILATNTSVSFTNTFTMFNEGPSPVNAALVYFLFPVQYEENVMIDQDSSKVSDILVNSLLRIIVLTLRKMPEDSRFTKSTPYLLYNHSFISPSIDQYHKC